MNRLPLQALRVDDVGRLLERLLVIAVDAVVIADDGLKIVMFNPAAEKLFGRSADEALGQPLDVLIPVKSRTRHGALVREFGRGPTSSRRMGERSEISGLRGDGTTFDAEASITHVEIESRTYYAAFVRDVTERHRAARELARSEQRFRELASSVPAGIFQVDDEGRCTYVNARWSTLTGVHVADAIGRSWLEGIHDDDIETMRDTWLDAVQRGVGLVHRLRWQRSDGAVLWLSCTCVPSRSADGKPSGWIGALSDITERQRQSEELERARAAAESAAKAKAQFLANVSHEIRTPLNGMIGMASLLMGTELSGEQREIAHTMLQSGEALLVVLNDVLDFSKVDAGKLEIDSQVFDLEACVEESLDVVAAHAHQRGLELAYWIDDATPTALVGDAARVRQILVNLLSNAVKFTHEGEVKVNVACEPVAGDTDRVRLRLSVSDTGIGIASEHLPRLFQSFSQVDTSTTRKYGGTGLGLAISKRLAELMDGSIDVRSEVGHGSTFVASIVLGVSPPPEPDASRAAQQPALAGKRLLIVDANLTNRRIVSRWARQWGMVVTTAPSMVEALDYVRRGDRFDAAVVDARPQGGDARAMVDELRREPKLARLPMLVLTSLQERTRVGRQPRLPDTHFMAKPIKTRELHRGLVSLWGAQAPAGHAAAPGEVAPGPDAAAAADARPLRLLVADDNELNRRVATSLARRLGHACDEAANGLEATDAVEHQAYDAILMDIQMPELDGLEAARWIMRRRGDAMLPQVVAMTANVGPADRERFQSAGIRVLLPKPVTLESMASALRQAMAQARGGGARTAGADSGAGTASGTGSEGGASAAGRAITSIDPKRLEQLHDMQGDSQPDLVRNLMRMFLGDAPGRVASLDDAYRLGDADELAARAHRLLSSTQNIGALRMSAVCMTIERVARTGRIADAQPLLSQLAQELAAAQAALGAALLRMER